MLCNMLCMTLQINSGDHRYLISPIFWNHGSSVLFLVERLNLDRWNLHTIPNQILMGVTLLFVHPCSATGYRPHPYAPVNSCDWPVWRRDVQFAIALQLNTSWDPSVTFMRARVGFLKVPQWRSQTRRRLKQRSAQSLHPLLDAGIRPWTAGLLVCPRRDAAVSRCHLVAPSAELRQLLFNFSYLSFP